jgi:hypothetical protein
MERRSASHDAALVVEASTDGGTSFAPVTGGPLPSPGGTGWVRREALLPAWTDGRPSITIRWRTAGDGTGTAGTIRFDDMAVAGYPRWDVSIAPGSVTPRHPLAGEEVRCAARITNTGLEPAAGVSVRWWTDADGDGAPDSPDPVSSESIGTLLPGDSSVPACEFVLPAVGPLAIIAIAAADSDMAAANDTARFRISAAAPPRSVVINEIMYDPSPGLPEYVELYNRSADSVILDGWRLVDEEDDSAGGEIAAGQAALGPGGYLVCSPDTGIRAAYPGIPGEAPVAEGLTGLSLNNGGDLILLVDGTGALVDRVDYLPGWHTPALDETRGMSLERIESSGGDAGGWNWGTSAGGSGGTPGRRNSLAAERSEATAVIAFSPNPFSPDGDGREDATVIAYRFGRISAVSRVRIYDRDGRLVRTIAGSSYVAGEGSFVWNGYDDRGRRVPVGIYVVLLDAVDGSGTEAFSARGAVVVAGGL